MPPAPAPRARSRQRPRAWHAARAPRARPTPCGFERLSHHHRNVTAVYVTRADLVLNGISMAFVGLELLLSLLTIITFVKAPAAQSDS